MALRTFHIRLCLTIITTERETAGNQSLASALPPEIRRLCSDFKDDAAVRSEVQHAFACVCLCYMKRSETCQPTSNLSAQVRVWLYSYCSTGRHVSLELVLHQQNTLYTFKYTYYLSNKPKIPPVKDQISFCFGH